MSTKRELNYSSQLQSFIKNNRLDIKKYKPTLTNDDRRIVHELAEQFGLIHFSTSRRNQRFITVIKRDIPINLYQFSDSTNAWEVVNCSNLEGVDNVRGLSVIQFNVLFEMNAKNPELDSTYTQYRRPALIEQLGVWDADIYALQEVTPLFYNELLEADWIKQGYYVSEGGLTIQGHGNIIISKYPIKECVYHHFPEDACPYKAFVLSSLIINERLFSIGVVHLKAGALANVTLREREVADAINLQNDNHIHDALLIGDFNFRDGGVDNEEPIESEVIESIYTDCWKEVHPDDLGLTYIPDDDHNFIARVVSDQATKRHGRKAKALRYDRAYIKSDRWTIQNIEKIGTEPFCTMDGNDIYYSDHFGLLSTFVYSPN
eukprot:TRINITY_DN2218_c0_g2_i1.p1 TRINITY_DN2218_c0_g2~~TRINITY_DN2218_c0_g2_i1.p1  ORF type:complete len:391 (+),score=63.55 TRINITY_DN2218_c0_g2_i1:47-1174(+)